MWSRQEFIFADLSVFVGIHGIKSLLASHHWSITSTAFALTAPLPVTTDGLYYVVFLKDGAWAGTDVQLGRSGSPPQDPTVTGGVAPFAQESTQTDLDASVTLSVANRVAIAGRFALPSPEVLSTSIV